MSGIFQFQSIMTTLVNAISGGLLSSIQGVAYLLMTISLVLGIYEAYVKGGDVRGLAATFLKYAVAAFVIGYWTQFFADTFTGFNQIASSIDSSYGAVDLLQSWGSGLLNLFRDNGYSGIFNSIPWTPSALLTLLEICLAYVIYPLATTVFALIYAFWGSCLFAMGPLVIALAPSSIINSLTKYFALNLAVWNAWTVIYAVFGCLITAIHGNDVNAVVNGDMTLLGFGTFSASATDPGGDIEMIGLISVVYAICILLIPMVATFVLRGQFSAVGAGVGLAISRIASAGAGGIRGGAAAGPVGAVAGAGLGLLGGGSQGIFSHANSSGGKSQQGGSWSGNYSSSPPPNTPPPNNPTRVA